MYVLRRYPGGSGGRHSCRIKTKANAPSCACSGRVPASPSLAGRARDRRSGWGAYFGGGCLSHQAFGLAYAGRRRAHAKVVSDGNGHARAGGHPGPCVLDSRFRGNDGSARGRLTQNPLTPFACTLAAWFLPLITLVWPLLAQAVFPSSRRLDPATPPPRGATSL